MRTFLKLSLFVVILLSSCEAANVLLVIPLPYRSHYVLFSQLGLELARRGHNVTVLSAFKEIDPPVNYRQVVPENNEVLKGINCFPLAEMRHEDRIVNVLMAGCLTKIEQFMKSNEFQDFIEKDNKFDVVISEQFYIEAFYMLAFKYSAPLVLVSTFGNCMKHNIAARNPLQLATLMAELIPIDEPSTFLGRLKNVYYSLYDYFWWRFYYLEKHEQLAKRYIPNLEEPLPSLFEIQGNVSLMLMNRHFSFEAPAAYLPNIVEVGGLHLGRNEAALPDDLKKILDQAPNGVVYMSLGTILPISGMTKEKLKIFLNVLTRLKHTVLLKSDDNNLTTAGNIVIRSWFPQNEILAHPNVKVFISHGGILGTQEAIYHGVPVIGMPVFADQMSNVLNLQEAGAGKLLHYHDLNEELLETALLEVIDDVKYKQRAKELSVHFKDRPMNALDTAMYWIEYVVRHKGANFAKNRARGLSWIAYNLIDVYIFVIMSLIALLYCLVKCATKSCYLVRYFMIDRKKKRE